MSKVVVLGRCGSAATYEAPKDLSCAWAAEKIGCEWVEIVRPKRLPKGFIMLCDEEGLLKRNFVNVPASWLYETDKHGEPIVGSVMILKEVMGPEGPEFGGMSDGEAADVFNKYTSPENLKEWAPAIAAKL